MPVRKIPRNYRHPTGVIALGDNQSTEFEGTLERDFALLMRGDPDFFGIESQPVRIEFETPEGKYTRFTPDYLVSFRAESGRRPLLVEVKPRSELVDRWDEYRLKFKMATRLCRERGWVFKIMTESKIRTPRLANLKRLQFQERHVPNELKAQRIIKLVRETPDATFDGVLAAVAPTMQQRMEWLPAVWSLIARRRLCTDLDVPITGHSRLTVHQI